ncbi:helix-turn-helix domain-containing protein [Paenibacillus sp. YN15]|uniref:response regulator transcription factor n=1 Tax=Paenibacillus sp. YN15 TaxID=1742774 RepID=UPI0015EC3A78|nr:helix-turn-helix domain-containing protein [Paenibacillus sp. YN15]
MEAYECIQEQRPQVVIADIRMPEMDGLTLMERVNELAGEVRFIFLSGYDLFDYAKQALHLGAVAYLLKPVKEAELKQALDKIQADLEQKKRQQAAWTKNRFRILYLSIDQYHELSRSPQPVYNDPALARFAVENIVLEIAGQHGITAQAFDVHDGIGLLLHYCSEEAAAREENIYALCRHLNHSISAYTKYTATIGIGQEVEQAGHIHLSFRTASHQIMQRLVLGGNRVITPGSAADANTREWLTPVMENQLMSYMENRMTEEAHQVLGQLFESVHSAKGDAADIRKLNLQCIVLYCKTMRLLDIDTEDTLGDEVALYHDSCRHSDMDSLLKWHCRILDACIGLIRAKSEDAEADNKLVQKALEHIHANYGGKLSLKNTADHVHLTPEYFSKLFKAHTATSFTDYLIHYRIRMARSLLKERIYKANEVAAMVGFSDVKHFYKTFKRLTGFTPQEYKNN